MGTISDEDKALLTDEELAGLIDDEEGEGADSADTVVADDEGDEDAGEAGNEQENGSAVAADKVDPAPAAAVESRDDGADDDDDDTPPAPKQADRVDATAAQARLDAIAAEKEALADKLDEGELTTKEYAAAVDRLNDEKNSVSNTLTRQTERDEAITQKWYGDVGKYLEKNPELNANDTRLQSFDAVVRRVTGDPENASLSNRKQLAKAHEIWREEMGIGTKAKEEPVPAKDPTPQPKPRKDLPPSLHNLPAADINDADDGKYSHLDALLNGGKVIEYENALGKLSSAEQDDYLSRA